MFSGHIYKSDLLQCWKHLLSWPCSPSFILRDSFALLAAHNDLLVADRCAVILFYVVRFLVSSASGELVSSIHKSYSSFYHSNEMVTWWLVVAVWVERKVKI